MIILGLNINHADTSACIIVNGKIIAAIEEERFVRIKHYAGLPINSIEFCLQKSELKLKDINFITVNYSPTANFMQKTFYSIKNILSKSLLKKIIKFKNKLFHTNELEKYLKENNFTGKIINVEHHMSHIASSYYNSSFKQSVGLTIDGFGDFCSTQTFLCNDNKIENIKKVYFPHSLGILYQSITQFLGFKNYGDEYKVMGLASYGKPEYINQFNELIKYDKKNLFLLNLDYFSHHTNSKFSYNFSDGIPKFPDLYSKKIIDLLGNERSPTDKIEQRHFDIAASLQLAFENILFLILNDLYDDTGIENLCLAGGCALNSKFNGLIKEKTPFKNIFIQPNAGDAGGAMGSALYFLQNKGVNKNKVEQDETNKCYLGTSYTNNFIEEKLIKNNKLLKNYSFKKLNDKDLYTEVANRISNNQIIGWFKGRCEWGPRALGNRSILADPRNPNIKDILNAKIKLRESFRPFAPSVLEEFSNKYFDLDYSSPYMLNVVKAKQLAKDLVPSVVHVDNTCRVQTVSKADNFHFYNLISEFNRLTNVPIILNTSFNENEPIVLNPDHAFDCFERTSMDCLVLENWVITR
tara:strand:+ start:8478 stop:10220 length:1743 start_codon:yes stop_codon:yes gene_type:complete